MGRKPNELVDETNRRILEEIQRDGRVAFKEIGDRIGLSCSAVSERVKRMEEAGLIQGFTARLDEEKIGLGIRAIIAVKCHSPVKEQELLDKLPGLAPVRQYWNVTGANDFFLEALFPSVHELHAFLSFLNLYGQPETSVTIGKPYKGFLKHDSSPSKKHR